MKIDPQTLTPAKIEAAQSEISPDILAILNEHDPESDAQVEKILSDEDRKRGIANTNGEQAVTRINLPCVNDKLKLMFARRKKIGQFKDPQPDENNPNAIFKYNYLRKGHFLLFVSTTGTGKSVFWTQGPLVWAQGKSFMGIEPAQRLSFAIFETEDDEDEIADFRNNFREGFKRDRWSEQQIIESERNEYAPVYYPCKGLSGKEFVEYVDFCLSYAREPHNVILINPFYDFIGGDMCKAKDVKELLNGLAVIAERHGCAVVLIHHTNKIPSTKKERDEWLCGNAASYAGSGSMVMPSSCRAVMFMRPLDQLGKFELIAGKRGERLRWKDKDGNTTKSKIISHSDGIIYWREPTPEELEELETSGGITKTPRMTKIAKNIEKVVEICRANGSPFESKGKLIAAIMNKAKPKSENTATDWIDRAIEAGKICTRKTNGQNVFHGTPEQFETPASDDDEPENYWDK